MADVEEVIRRLKTRPSNGVVITDRAQRVVRSSYTGERAGKADVVCACVPMLVQKAEAIVQDVDPLNSLLFLRIKLRSGEILVASDADFHLIVAQSEERGRGEEVG